MKSVAALIALTVAPQLAQSTNANPIQKVLEMVGGLEQKLIAEGAETQKVYNEKSKYCEQEAQNFGFEIKTGKGQISKLQASIESDTASATALSAKIEDLSGDISSNEADLKAAAGVRAKEAADFGAEESELSTTVDMLERAVSVLTKEGSASMLQVNSANSVTDALRVMVQAMSLSSADGSKLTALVQQSSKSQDEDEDSEMGAPAAAVTENQSGGIVGVLEGLLEKAQEQLDKARKEEATSAQNHAMLKQSLTDEVKFAQKDMAEAKAEMAASQESKAVAGGDLEGTKVDLKGDQAAKQDLHQSCMATAQEYEASVTSLGEELKALAQAKKIIQEGTGAASSQSYGLEQVSFVQMEAKSSKLEAVRFVRNLAARHKDVALAQLASRMNSALRLNSGASGPFDKVKGLITDMLTTLEEAAGADATQKAYCDKEQGETKANKDDKSVEVQGLTTKVAQKSAQSAKLKEQAATLQSELADMVKGAAELSQVRQEEKAIYEKNQPEMEQGLAAIKQALKVLRDYYGGNGGGSTGIIGLLEVCESDFSKGLAEMNVQEETAASEFESAAKAFAVEKVAKDKDQSYKTKEASGLDKAVSELSGDESGSQEQLDAIVEYESKIDKQCTVMPESYEERKKRRESEIEGLKQAMTILEGESLLQTKSTRHLRAVRHHA